MKRRRPKTNVERLSYQNNGSQRQSIIYIAVGALLGSGGAGAAIEIIGEGSQTVGILWLLICVSAACVLTGIEKWDERQIRKENLKSLRDNYADNLKSLSDYYVESMISTGQLFLARDSEKKVHSKKMLKALAKDLRNYGLLKQRRGGGNEELKKEFQSGVKEISEKWEAFADKGAIEDDKI